MPRLLRRNLPRRVRWNLVEPSAYRPEGLVKVVDASVLTAQERARLGL